MFANVIFEYELTYVSDPEVLKVITSPFKEVRLPAARTAASLYVPETTWYLSVEYKFDPKIARPGTGAAANPVFIGAKTVKGPVPLRAPTNPPGEADKAATREERVGVAMAVSAMVC